MRGRKPYVKLYESWWTSRSHISIPTTTLGVGARLLSMANGNTYSDEGAGLLIHPDGTPFSVDEIAHSCRMDRREISGVIQAFLKVGTMQKYPSGAYGFPNQERWQTSHSTKRMRRLRARESRKTSGEVPSHSDGFVRVTDASPERTQNPAQIDLEQVIQSVSHEATLESPSGNPVKRRHSDGASDGASDAVVTGRVKRDINGTSSLTPHIPPNPKPDKKPTQESRKGNPEVDVVQRCIDHWWLKLKAEKPKSRVKPGPSSPAARAVKRILKTSYFVDSGPNETRKVRFTEHDVKLAIDGCFLSPYHLGKNDSGTQYLALTLICRDEEKMRTFMDLALEPPKPQLQPRPTSGSDALKEWNACREVMERTTH